MPFTLVDCTPEILEKLGLPLQLDERHRYFYRLHKHSDDDVFYVVQSYVHGPETFAKLNLLVGEKCFSVKDEIAVVTKRPPWAYKLTAVRIFAEAPLSDWWRTTLHRYLVDILQTYTLGLQFQIPRNVEMHVVEDVQLVDRWLVR